MKRMLLSITGALCLGWISLSQAETSPALVIQVPESFYQHPVRLLNPYLNY